MTWFNWLKKKKNTVFQDDVQKWRRNGFEWNSRSHVRPTNLKKLTYPRATWRLSALEGNHEEEQTISIKREAINSQSRFRITSPDSHPRSVNNGTPRQPASWSPPCAPTCTIPERKQARKISISKEGLICSISSARPSNEIDRQRAWKPAGWQTSSSGPSLREKERKKKEKKEKFSDVGSQFV